MKRLLSLFLALLVLVSFSACKKDDGGDASGESDAASAENSSAVLELPDVAGKPSAEAVKAINDAGYTNVKTVKGHKAGVAADAVIAQSRAAGSVYDADTPIILQISNGLSAGESAKTPIDDPLLADRKKLEAGANSDYKPLNYDGVKGIWLSQLDMIPVYYDYDKEVQRNQDDFA